jgi:type II secretory pathway pseudopilin PulG
MIKQEKAHNDPQSMSPARCATSAGFTLLEISFVIIIIGITMIPILQAIERYYTQRQITLTRSSIDSATTLINEYKGNTGSYPCPSKRALAFTDNEYGESVDCRTAADITALGLTPNSCNAAIGMCLVELTGVDKDGDTFDDRILIGSFPLASIIAADADGDVEFRSNDLFSTRMDIDAWNNQLTYAISLTFADSNNKEKYWAGVINAVDEHGNPTAGMGGDAHFVILSHGPDGKGAYNQNGKIGRPCGSVTANTFDDDENCNNDGTFVQALGMYQGTPGETYDDFIRFSKEVDNAIWLTKTFDPTPAMPYSGDERIEMWNGPPGSVGINMMTTPSEKLDINGALAADYNIRTDQICDHNGNCFKTEILSNTNGLLCPAGQYMKGIKNGDKICEVPKFEDSVGSGKLAPQNCGAGWVHGFKTDGSVICY